MNNFIMYFHFLMLIHDTAFIFCGNCNFCLNLILISIKTHSHLVKN